MLSLFRRWYERHFSQPGTIEFALVLICAFLIVYYLMWLVGPIVVALCIAFCLDWPVQALEKFTNCSRRLASIIVMFLFCSIVILITVLVIPQIVKQGAEFYNSIVSFSLETSQPKEHDKLQQHTLGATTIRNTNSQNQSLPAVESSSTTQSSNAASSDNQSLSLAASKISKDNAHVTKESLNAETKTLHSMLAQQAVLDDSSDGLNAERIELFEASEYVANHDNTATAKSQLNEQTQVDHTSNHNNQDLVVYKNSLNASQQVTTYPTDNSQYVNAVHSAVNTVSEPTVAVTENISAVPTADIVENTSSMPTVAENVVLPQDKQDALAINDELLEKESLTNVVSEQVAVNATNSTPQAKILTANTDLVAAKQNSESSQDSKSSQDYASVQEQRPQISYQDAARIYSKDTMPNLEQLIKPTLPQSILQELEFNDTSTETSFKLTVYDFDTRLAHEAAILLMELPEPLPGMLTMDVIKNAVRYVRTQSTLYLADLMRTQLMPSVVNLFTWAVYLIIVPIFTFLMLFNKDELKKRATLFILPNNQVLMRKFWPSLHQQIAGYIRGKLIHIILMTIANSIAFKLLNVNYALLLGVGVGLSVVIPYVGAVIIAVPVVLVAIFQFGFSEALLWVLVIYTIIQLLDSNVLTPMLFSKAMNLDAFSILAAILIFGGLWGFWGVFFAIPLATFIKTIVMQWPNKDVREQQKREHLRQIQHKKSECSKQARI